MTQFTHFPVMRVLPFVLFSRSFAFAFTFPFSFTVSFSLSFTENQKFPLADEDTVELVAVLESASESAPILGVFGEGGSRFLKQEPDGLLGTDITWVSSGELGRFARFAMI
jgi:hypothetical protein